MLRGYDLFAEIGAKSLVDRFGTPCGVRVRELGLGEVGRVKAYLLVGFYPYVVEVNGVVGGGHAYLVYALLEPYIHKGLLRECACAFGAEYPYISSVYRKSAVERIVRGSLHRDIVELRYGQIE